MSSNPGSVANNETINVRTEFLENKFTQSITKKDMCRFLSRKPLHSERGLFYKYSGFYFHAREVKL